MHAQLLELVLGVRVIRVELVVSDGIGEVAADGLQELGPEGAVGGIDDQGRALAVLVIPRLSWPVSNSDFRAAPFLLTELA